MTQVLHLIDDPRVGGVNRGLTVYLPRLTDGFTHQVLQVPANRLPTTLPPADIVVIHFTPNWAKLPFLLALRLRYRDSNLILVEHSYTEAYERLCVPHRGRFRAMLRIAYRLVDRVVAVSHHQAAWLRTAKVVAPERLIAIPNACDVGILATVPDLVRHGGQLRLGAYGRYVPQKGFDTLIAAMRAVPASVATLTLAGYGPDEALLHAAAAGLDHVRIRGPIDGPASFLAEVDAVLVPSRYEAFGVVAAEVRAAGRPVLVAAVDGLIEQLDPAWGIQFAPENPAAIADAIKMFATRDRIAMGAAARRSVAGSMDATIAAWFSLLKDLAGPRKDLAGTGASRLTGISSRSRATPIRRIAAF